MKTLFVLFLSLTLTGCATGCREACLLGFGPGNAAFDLMAKHYDEKDPCQYKGKPQGYTLPNFCGANGKNIAVTHNGQTKYYYVKVRP